MTNAAVGREDLERQLEVVRALAPGEMEGVFGPDSLTWRIDREALTFLGAGRALLLQLAHPWVAAAIAEHSKTIDDPIGRFHRTFAVVFTMVFGTLDQALSAPRDLHRRHNSLGPHIWCWLIWPVWLAVSDAAIYSRIFGCHLLRRNSRG